MVVGQLWDFSECSKTAVNLQNHPLYSSLAQSVVHSAVNRGVARSNRARRAILSDSVTGNT